MKQRLKERDVTFLPKGGSKKKERNEEKVEGKQLKRLNQKKGRRPVWIIKAQISQQASRERENDSLNSNP
ncbi:hypothetical protein GmHk_13G038399 [Glycine max]|nr:hypothetical protein GmHk_13G038399 [Glycine max]